MKKKVVFSVIIGLLILLIISLAFLIGKYYKIKHAKVFITYLDPLEVEFLQEAVVNDFIVSINGKVINNHAIDTTIVGEQEIHYEYINEDNIKLKQSFKINVVDKIPPLIWLNKNYYVEKGSTINLTKKILCGDNYDNKPICEVIGEYDLNTSGKYNLVFKATDNSGNVTTKDFILNVTDSKEKDAKKPKPKPAIYFSDIVAKYKNNKTQIGLDISKWQGDVDFQKLKAAGVEFVILRVGGQRGINGAYFVDPKFEQNFKRASKENIPVGIYFHSYAKNEEDAKKDALFVLKNINDKNITLPIAFDWENWSIYNEFELSFYKLTQMAKSYLDTIKENGYEGLLYSSKVYLENMWLNLDYPIWLAHYIDKTNYLGKYTFWQLANTGKVDGIKGAVDIDIRYLE